MHARTRKTLLGLGFDTDMVEVIARHGHTVEALRSLPNVALRQAYTDEQVGLIQAKIVRQPIPEDVVARVLAAAAEACCYCEDGINSRPYQIHHIDLYSATQDHSEENLLVVCPTHHAVIHGTKISAEAQKHTRRKWHALVALAERFRAAGVDFPFGSLVAVDYAGEASAGELVREIRVTPPTALAVSRHSLATEVKDLVLRDRFALLLGPSGDGKTTLALGVSGLLHGDGWRVFRYRPPDDKRVALREILQFIAVAAQESVIILDDVNAWLSGRDLEEVAAGVSGKAAVIATWTREKGGDDTRMELHLPKWVPTDWARLAPSVREFLARNEAEVVTALRVLEDERSVRRIGLGMFQECLTDRIGRYEQEAKTVSEFLFLMRGGADVVRKELGTLIERDRADVPVLYAAVEQIAEVERPVTPDEVAQSLGSLGEGQRLPPPTATWVKDVFEQERSRRRMQRRREAYTTIHRDWARQLVCAALGDARARPAITAILARDFNVRTPRPIRTMRLWSWLWYDDHGTPFVRNWAASLTPDDWKDFVGTASASGLEEAAFVADRLHILVHSEQWTGVVGEAFAAHAGLLSNHVSKATPECWPSLRRLFMAMDHACPDAAARLVRAWPPDQAAQVFARSHPDSFYSASWFFAGVQKHSREWCTEVGKRLDWEQVSQNLARVEPGDLEAVSECQTILGRLGVPLMRSMLRRYTQVMRECLASATLMDLTAPFADELNLVLSLYPNECQQLAAALDPAGLAAQLSVASPRHWRTLGDLAALIHPSYTRVYEEIVALIDADRFGTTVASYGAHCPYELRCLVWFLRRGPAAKRLELAKRIADTVEQACRKSDVERPELLEAMAHLDRALAERLAAQLTVPLVLKRDIDEADKPFAERNENWAQTIAEVEALDRAGQEYDVGAMFGNDDEDHPPERANGEG